MRRFSVVLLSAVLLGLVPAVASAGCTANRACSNGCNFWLECPSPPYSQPWNIYCSTPDQYLQCSGQNTCTSGADYVDCDGQRQTCIPYSSNCYYGTDYIRCGSNSMSCSQCQSGAINCFI
jgi:hypothetical protein